MERASPNLASHIKFFQGRGKGGDWDRHWRASPILKTFRRPWEQ